MDPQGEVIGEFPANHESCELQVEVLDDVTAAQLAATFAVLSDPTRVRMISALSGHSLCVHELAEALSMTHSAVSHQLATLRGMRLVNHTRSGRHVYYELDDDHIHDLFAQGLAHIRHA
jgi:DNA-binding transcriptional ArsR family regulator